MNNRKKCFIFDIDGVLSDPSHRIKHAEDKDWDNFHMLSVYDKPIIDACRICRILNKHFPVIFITGRPEKFRNITERWLAKNVFDTDKPLKNKLLMRPNDNFEPSYKLKIELYDKIKTEYRAVGVYEDNSEVVNMWRGNGFCCFSMPEVKNIERGKND